MKCRKWEWNGETAEGTSLSGLFNLKRWRDEVLDLIGSRWKKNSKYKKKHGRIVNKSLCPTDIFIFSP